jgi:hypothetical protein
MKLIAFLGLLLILCSCSDKGNETPLSELLEHNKKIIPEKPGSQDEIKLVIIDDCTYNILSKNKRDGKTIEIEKQFNGMMKWPCVQQNDTILIGILPHGTYNVNYTLIDISQQAPQNISFSFSFQLAVGK